MNEQRNDPKYIRIAYYTAQPSCIDPFHGFDPDSYTAIMACHDSLTHIAEDGELIPGLATSWNRISDTCMEFELRQGVQFHNGEDFNAEAIQATIHAQICPDNNSPTGQAILSIIDRVEIINPFRIHIHTKHPDGMLPWRMTLFSATVPPKLLKEKGVDYFINHPVGTGPYIFDSMERNKSISYKINPNYWGKKPEVEGIKFVILPSRYWVEALENNNIDLVYGLYDAQLGLLEHSQKIEVKSKQCALSHWFLLSSNGPLKDQRVRLAMNLAVNNNILTRFQSRSTAIVQKSVATEGQFGYNPNIREHPYNVDKARALLKEAGYENGFTLKGLVADHSGSLVQLIAAFLSDIGIKLEFEIVPRPLWMDSIQNSRLTGKGSYPVDFAVAPVDNPSMYSGFHHYIFLSNDGPFSLQDNKVYQEKFVHAMTRTTLESCESELQKLDKFVHDEALLLFTIQSQVHLAMNPGVEMVISKNGHFDTTSLVSLKDSREGIIEQPDWNFDYKEIHTPIPLEEFNDLLTSTECSELFWHSDTDHIEDPRIKRLIKNLMNSENKKTMNERYFFNNVVELLKQSNDLIGLFDTNTFSGIATFSLDGNITRCNAVFSELFAEQGTKTTLSDLFFDTNSYQIFLKNLKENKGFWGSLDIKKNNNKILEAQVACSLRLDDTGDPNGFVLFIRDEKEERKLKRDLEESYSEMELKVQERTFELQDALDKVKATHAQLVQNEKMASLGQLAAGVAHEINNPVCYVKSNLSSLQAYVSVIKKFISGYEDLTAGIKNFDINHAPLNKLLKTSLQSRKEMDVDYILSDLDELINESKEGAERIQEIVQGLKNFARLDEEQYKTANINEGIETTLKIVWNEIKYKCNLKKELGDIPLIQCYPGQLNQVFLNLLVNAAQSIPDKGEISVKTFVEGSELIIQVSDDGIGIPKEVHKKLFDPFFTTKPPGEGTGLGLSVSHSIIKKHNGTILCDSEYGKGTEFTIKLPLNNSNQLKKNMSIQGSKEGE